MNKFIPQALACPKSRTILHVFCDEENFRTYWADKVKTIDAPGVETHPRLIKVGDVIDWYMTGWTKALVTEIKFVPDYGDIPDYYRVGTYCFRLGHGNYYNIRVDGKRVLDSPMYVFRSKNEN